MEEKKTWRRLLYDTFHRENFLRRTLVVIPATVMMGFSLSWLLLVDLGADPCTAMNRAIAATLGLSLGNWQALLNCVLLVIVVIFGGRNLGVGTLSNMFLVGYSVDFFSWLWEKIGVSAAFESLTVRVVMLCPALALFVASAAVYMAVDMGTAPYDAIPFMISKRVQKIPFRVIRMAYDFLVIAVACLFGGKPQIVTILMALSLGPVVDWVSRLGKRLFPKLFGEAAAQA